MSLCVIPHCACNCICSFLRLIMRLPLEILTQIFTLATRTRGSAASWILCYSGSKHWQVIYNIRYKNKSTDLADCSDHTYHTTTGSKNCCMKKYYCLMKKSRPCSCNVCAVDIRHTPLPKHQSRRYRSLMMFSSKRLSKSYLFALA